MSRCWMVWKKKVEEKSKKHLTIRHICNIIFIVANERATQGKSIWRYSLVG